MGNEHRGKVTSHSGPLFLILKGIRWVISVSMAITGTVLFFLGLSMLLIYLVDSVVYGNDPYINWLPNIYLPVVLSLLSFAIFLILNLDRFRVIPALRRRFKTGRGTLEVEELDLD